MISLVTVFASTEITVSTDKVSYLPDELVTISGEAEASVLVTIDVKNSLETRILLRVVQAETSGAYETVFRLPVDAIEGTYTVDVSAPEAMASMTFTVEETGNLSISTTPTGGEVFVNGTYWGDAPVFEEVAVGTYNVSFGEMDGYVTPEPIIATVVADTTEEILGIYTVEQPEIPAETTGEETLDSTGTPKTSFVVGETVQISSDVTNVGNEDQPVIVVVQLMDPDYRPLPLFSFAITLNPGQLITPRPEFPLPTTGYTAGTWTATIMILDDWPAQGGVPIGDPVTITFTVMS